MAHILIIGHSHILTLRAAHAAARRAAADDVQVDFLLLRDPAFLAPREPGETEQQHKARAASVAGIDRAAVAAHIAALRPDAAVLCIGGNENSVLGLIRDPALDLPAKLARVERAVRAHQQGWLAFLLPLLPANVWAYPAPPPPDAMHFDGVFPAGQVAVYQGRELEPPAVRLTLWQRYREVSYSELESRGGRRIELPPSVLDATGLLARDCWGSDPTHANREFGRRVLGQVIATVRRDTNSSRHAGAGAMALAPDDAPGRHPYQGLPDSAFWAQSVGARPPEAVDPVGQPRFQIAPDDRVATAGSCFAQHISKRLRAAGFGYLVAEPPTGPGELAEARGFHDFSARYGNLYTARQLLQLFDRAFGYFQPLDTVWARHGGGYCDPFRPRIEPDGFASEAAVHEDRGRHLAAVRAMFCELDVFVFTLGLTECWVSRLDSAAYPVCPGVVGGRFDPAQHAFVNFTAAEVVADLQRFQEKLRLVNPRARMLLTVSPVPLVATASGEHVLRATVYSKSVLRVAAEEIVRRHAHIEYFPSYEIITGPHASGRYFADDLRSVTPAGVDHVMCVFMERMTCGAAAAPGASAGTGATSAATRAFESLQGLSEAACDEEVLRRA